MKIDQLISKLNGNEIENAINNYGKKTILKEGKVYELSQFIGSYENITDIEKFVALDEGCETWLKGHKYPMRQCFNNERVKTTHQFKRLIPTITRSFKNSPIATFFHIKKNYQLYLDFIHKGMGDVYYSDSKYYSQPVREIHLILTAQSLEKERDIVCAILENDAAYRYRVQDVLMELNKKEIWDHPIKELRRLLDILLERELGGGGLKKFKWLFEIGLIYLWFNKSLLLEVRRALLMLDVNQIESKVEDQYWQCRYEDYNFMGMTLAERKVFQTKL